MLVYCALFTGLGWHTGSKVLPSSRQEHTATLAVVREPVETFLQLSEEGKRDRGVGMERERAPRQGPQVCA